MLRELFINTLILISFISVGGLLFRDCRFFTIKDKILFGIVGGVLGSILMAFSIKIPPIVIIDFRFLAIMITAIYSNNILPPAITAFIISAVRILFFGLNPASISCMIISTVTLICIYIIQRFTSVRWKQWFFISLCSLIIASIGFLVILRNVENTYQIILTFNLFGLFTIGISYIISEYVHNSNIIYWHYKNLSERDYLTGLNNIRQFETIIDKSLKIAEEQEEKLSLLFLDIDHFKKINDTYGHSIGDEVLKELGSVLTETCRNHDIVSRYGGEEFTVILPNCSKAKALEVAERIRLAVQKHKFIHEGNKISITVSIGVATYPDSVSNVDELIAEADRRLYMAKSTGRNKVC